MGNDLSKKKFMGIPVWLIAVVVVAFFAYNGGHLDQYIGGSDAGAVSEQTIVAGSGVLALDSEFVEVEIGNTDVASSTVNFNSDTNVVSIQVDAEVSDDGTDTLFVMKGVNVAGTTVELINTTVSGSVLTEMATDETVEMEIIISESYDSGFTTTLQAADASVSASANRLLGDDGQYFYPIALRAGSLAEPQVKVDGSLDTKSYSWTTATTDKTITVTCPISFNGVNQMDNIVDKVVIPVTAGNGDDSPITVELIKNTAL